MTWPYFEVGLLTGRNSYQVPAYVREHIDYITPGVAMREVTGLQTPGKKLGTRTFGGIAPKPSPIGRPVNSLKSNTSKEWCSLAVTPQCIRGMLLILLITFK